MPATRQAQSRRRIRFPSGEALITVQRVPGEFAEVVYVITANKQVIYARGRSRVIYVGRTEAGLQRLCTSAAIRGGKAFSQKRGIRAIKVWPLTWAQGEDVGTAKILERAFLLRFREIHGQIPILNKQGVRMRERDEFDHFRRIAVDRAISGFS